MKTYSYEEIKQDQNKYKEVFEFIEKYGSHTMAYSILQPKMYYFIEDSIGLIAYAKHKKKSKRNYVLSDPFCKEEDKERLIEDFLKHYPKSSFVQISSKIANILKNHKFYSTPMGIETTIILQKFDINGERKGNLRNNIRVCKKELIVKEENELSETNNPQLKIISDIWLKERKKTEKELHFLARPFVIIPEKGVRKFFAIKEDNIVGFVVFNPMYINNNLIGYCADITRTLSDAPRGTGDYILYLALKKFRREGHKILSLGMSPFADLYKDKLGLHDNSTLRILKILYHGGNKLYHFKGLNEHKKQFEAEENHVYFGHKRKFPIIQIYQLFKICNVI